MRLSDFAPRINGQISSFAQANPTLGVPRRRHGVHGLGIVGLADLINQDLLSWVNYPGGAGTPQQFAAAVAGDAQGYCINWPDQCVGVDVNGLVSAAVAQYSAWYAGQAIQSPYPQYQTAPPPGYQYNPYTGVLEPIPNALTSNAPSGTSSITPSVSLNKGQYTVGDTYQVFITGAPNQPINVLAQKDGVILPLKQVGMTDSTGHATITGVMDSSSVGSWVEAWYVGLQNQAVVVGSVSFTVSASALTPPISKPPVTSGQVQNTQTQGASQATVNGTSGSNTTASTQPGTFDWLTKPISDSIPIPLWAVIAGGVAAVMVIKD